MANADADPVQRKLGKLYGWQTAKAILMDGTVPVI
jgi:hypothetical protein